MRKWWNTYIKSLRKDIVILLIIDSLILLLMELVLKKIPAPFPVFVTLGISPLLLGFLLLPHLSSTLFRSICLKQNKKPIFIRASQHCIPVC